MFAKDKVSQSLIDAVSNIVENSPVKIPTPTGTRVLGGSYGNSAKAHKDQTKKDIDKLKGPKDSEMKEDYSFSARLIAHAKLAEEVEQEINEVLSKDASAGDWIHDFIHSDNPKFAGKSKAERKKMALGAYYGKKNEGYEGSEEDEKEDKKEAKKRGMTHAEWEKSEADKKQDKKKMKEEVEADSEITTDTLKGRESGGKANAFKSFKLKVKGDHTPKEPEVEKPEHTAARASIHAEEVELDEETPKKNQDIADKSHLKDMSKKPTIKSDLKNFKNFLTGKKETNEEKSNKKPDWLLAAELKAEKKEGKLKKEEVEELDEAQKMDDASRNLLIHAHQYATGKVHKKLMNGGYKDKGEMAIHHAQELHHALSTLGRGEKLKEEVESIEEKNWIAGAIKHPGALTKKAKAAGETNSEYEQQHKHDSGKTGKQARLALTLKKLNKEEVEELEEASSRKDFQMVADLIKTHDDHDKRKMLAQHHAEIFHRQNPRFDRAKFMQAANVNEAKTLSPGQDDAPFDAPYTTTPSDIKDKSGAVHTPMSRARDLARQAMKKVKNEMLGKAPANNG